MFTRSSRFHVALAALASLAVLLCAPAATRAQTVISSLPYTITVSGNYVLSGDLASTQTSGNLIEIDASNVTLDMQDYYISGGSGTTGIYAYEQGKLTIRNGTISKCDYGIVIQGNGTATTNNTVNQIDNIRVRGCSIIGIDLEESPSSRITNCQLAQIGNSSVSGPIGINVNGPAVTVQGNSVSVLTGASGAPTYCIFVDPGTFVRGNQVSGATFGVQGGIYQLNLADNCTTPFDGGVDGGSNVSD